MSSKKLKLLEYWISQVRAEASKPDGCMFQKDVERLELVRAALIKNSEHDELKDLVARRFDMCQKMMESGMEEVCPAVMEQFARDHELSVRKLGV